jgi:hypothetical protein
MRTLEEKKYDNYATYGAPTFWTHDKDAEELSATTRLEAVDRYLEMAGDPGTSTSTLRLYGFSPDKTEVLDPDSVIESAFETMAMQDQPRASYHSEASQEVQEAAQTFCNAFMSWFQPYHHVCVCEVLVEYTFLE